MGLSILFEFAFMMVFVFIAVLMALYVKWDDVDDGAQNFFRGGLRKLFAGVNAINAKIAGLFSGVTPSTSTMSEEAKTHKTFEGAEHSMIDNSNQNNQNLNVLFENVQPQKIECNSSSPNTTVQIILIGGSKETLKVNLTNTVLEIYAHFKAISGYQANFYLMAGFPPKTLSNPNGTVDSEQLKGTRITQKKSSPLNTQNSFFSKFKLL